MDAWLVLIYVVEGKGRRWQNIINECAHKEVQLPSPAVYHLRLSRNKRQLLNKTLYSVVAMLGKQQLMGTGIQTKN